ncbi:MAG: hypothetical protein KJ968_04420, partial [Nanoarchaeota archaeon]|nr:hypothetical protein [Nanoarchaeota archaeon]
TSFVQQEVLSGIILNSSVDREADKNSRDLNKITGRISYDGLDMKNNKGIILISLVAITFLLVYFFK